MFAGHAAIAFAARSRLPRQTLGVLFVAVYFIDLIWPVLLLAGLERVEIDPGNTAFTPLDFVSYPWSHSLAAAAAWGVLFGGIVLTFGGRENRRPREFVWLAALVVSHWVLDALTHRPDLPLTPGGSARVGLGLWNSIPATLIIEGALFGAGLALYLRSTIARDRIGRIGITTLAAVIVLIWASGPFSPPPPSARAIGIVGLLMWLLPVWAGWADRHRELTIIRRER